MAGAAPAPATIRFAMRRPSPAPLLTLAAVAALTASSAAAQDRMTTTVQVGDAAPDFTLEDAQGNAHRLSEIVERGPVVLEFFRSGGW